MQEMEMQLPEAFTRRMQQLLGTEYQEFLDGYQKENAQGLRVNTLKISPEQFVHTHLFSLEPIPWADGGFYYSGEDRPGRHPFHEAGLYYIQEPSAMAVGQLVDPQPGERVLDLCAAPGGKTTHMAARMQGKGFLLANEPYPARAKILAQNLDRLGVAHAVVTCEQPQRLAQRFGGYFDRVLVDAPCSGEGMFRKNPLACSEWSEANVEMCADRQMEILRSAQQMLRPGGRLVYSTCTFSPEENEQVICRFLDEFPGWEVEQVEVCPQFSPGRISWGNGNPGVEHTFRLWPHRLRGEGHYIAVLRKGEHLDWEGHGAPAQELQDRAVLKDYLQFAKENLAWEPEGKYVLFGGQLFCMPPEMLSMERLKVVRPGLPLGTLKKNRFEPEHGLALALAPGQALHRCSFAADSSEIAAYLRGETLELSEGEKGWYLVEVDGFGLGWAKYASGTLKNHYPKGLRRMG